MSIYSDCMGIGMSAIEDAAGEKITYRNGATDLCITAVAEDTAEQDIEVGGNRITSITRTQAFLIRPKVLKADGVQFKPAQKHLIQRADGQWYRVQNPSGAPVWEWSGASRTHYRVYAVEIADPT